MTELFSSSYFIEFQLITIAEALKSISAVVTGLLPCTEFSEFCKMCKLKSCGGGGGGGGAAA
jgi:hypothetical protein